MRGPAECRLGGALLLWFNAMMRTLLLLALVACAREEPPARALELVGFQQDRAEDVLLNENLVFYFSADLDPVSVTPSSARVLDQGGRMVDGALRAEGNRLVFEPDLSVRSSLRDGGFVPGGAYRVELTGFPVISGLRSRDGLVLEQGFSSRFSVVGDDGERGLFLDPSPQTAAGLYLASSEVGVSAPIVLECAEPLDPRSISAERFELRFAGDEGVLAEVPLAPSLVQNSMTGGARLELRAVEAKGSLVPRPLEPGAYHLWVTPGITDLGGQPVASTWAVTQTPARLNVALRPEETGNRSLRIDFLDASLGSPEELSGYDGALLWDGSGALRVGFHAAAGDGSAGTVALRSGDMPLDVQAARLSLGADESVTIAPRSKAAVLRSQTELRIDGSLVRRAAAPELERGEDEAWADWYGRRRGVAVLAELGRPGGPTLHTWLAEEADREWTALVAGGDLIIDGNVRIDGPLLLVAGGRIRVGGRIEASEVWTVGPGGGSRILPPARPAELKLEPPNGNPLVVPLRLGHMSAPVRPTGEPIRWRSAAVGSISGAGRVHVRYLGERDRPNGAPERIGPVDDAALLDRCEALRLIFEVELEPSPTWDPPMVDFVEVRWTAETQR